MKKGLFKILGSGIILTDNETKNAKIVRSLEK